LEQTRRILLPIFKDNLGVTLVFNLEEFELFICHAGKESGKVQR
jgi:hypothetical protein